MDELIFVGYVSLVSALILVIPKSLDGIYKHIIFSMVLASAIIIDTNYSYLSQSLKASYLTVLGFLAIVIVASTNALYVVDEGTEEWVN